MTSPSHQHPRRRPGGKRPSGRKESSRSLSAGRPLGLLGLHHRLRLLDRLLEYLPVSRFVSSFGSFGPHSEQTANRSVRNLAKNFAFEQSDANLLTGTEAGLQPEMSGMLLKYALRQDRVLVERVLDYGRQYTRWNSEF
jgi:hypothetical protein